MRRHRHNIYSSDENKIHSSNFVISWTIECIRGSELQLSIELIAYNDNLHIRNGRRYHDDFASCANRLIWKSFFELEKIPKIPNF